MILCYCYNKVIIIIIITYLVIVLYYTSILSLKMSNNIAILQIISELKMVYPLL